MFVYDLAQNPPWFDFVTWLMGRATEAQGPFDLQIVLGRRPDRVPVDDVTREAMFHTIMLPATQMFHVKQLSILPPGPIAGPKHEYLGRCLRQNRPIPGLKVPEWALEYVKKAYPDNLVTISLREAPHNSWRNSDLAVWEIVVGELEKKGYAIAVLRDVMATTEIGLPSDWRCTHNLYLRAALYERARMNLGTMNGICTMATHNPRANYCFHGMGPPVGGWNNATMREAGYEPDEDLPWALPGQRTIWDKGTPESILSEFERTPKTKNETGHFEPLT